MAGRGDVEGARRTIQVAYDEGGGWAKLLRRMVEDGFLELRPEVLAALLPQREPTLD